MKTAFLALVNYGLAVLLLAYTVQAFLCVYKEKKQNGILCRFVMKAEMVLLLGLCFFTLYVCTGEAKILYFFLLQLAAYGTITFVYKKLYPRMSELLFHHMLLLSGIGSVLLTRLDFDGALRQFVIVVAALVLALFIPGFIRKMHRIERYGYGYLAIGIMVLLFVFLFAGERLGARIWVKLFGVAMQPFEFVKLLFIFGCAAVLLRAKTWKGMLAGILLAGIHVLLMAASKDLGGALLFAVVFWVLLYSVSGRKRWIFGGLFAAGGACVAVYFLFSHVQVRILAWQNPFAVVENEGYQLAQSLFAIGNGGFFGTGLYRGAPELIPVVTTDYIFSALCEELGAIFAMGLLGVYVNCIILFIRMAAELSEDYYRLVFTGFTALFTTQVVLNVGGVIRMIPATGVPLPLVSAGGSSAASMVLMIMLIQGMQERRQEGMAVLGYKGGFTPGILTERARKGIKHCQRGCVVALCAVICYFAGFICTEARTVIFHSYNRRQIKLEEQNARGTIFDAEGNPLAVTILSDGKEQRKYPYGALYSHVVGQVQNGSSGLEAVKEIELLSSSASELSKLLYRVRGAQIPGNNLFTTLQTDLQKTVYAALNGADGAVCVLDLESGGVVATVSLPDFNPENVSEKETEGNAPLFNRAFYGLYPVEEATGIFRAAAAEFENRIPTPFDEEVLTEKAITPLGAALFAGACAKGGVYIYPHVAAYLTDASGKVIYRTKAKQVRLFETEKAVSYRNGFVEVEEEGVSYAFAKTMVDSGTRGRQHHMAMALIPAKNPQVAVGIVLEHVKYGEEDYIANILKEVAAQFIE